MPPYAIIPGSLLSVLAVHTTSLTTPGETLSRPIIVNRRTEVVASDEQEDVQQEVLCISGYGFTVSPKMPDEGLELLSYNSMCVCRRTDRHSLTSKENAFFMDQKHPYSAILLVTVPVSCTEQCTLKLHYTLYVMTPKSCYPSSISIVVENVRVSSWKELKSLSVVTESFPWYKRGVGTILDDNEKTMNLPQHLGLPDSSESFNEQGCLFHQSSDRSPLTVSMLLYRDLLAERERLKSKLKERVESL
eukprot:Tbor_TRINITY_DN885_c0_g1::TRINITY_DN885_c0_g1_i1::g.26633::m.26633